MHAIEGGTPPSPVGALARLLPPVPHGLVQPWLDLALGAMAARHPALFRRLDDQGRRRIRIIARDLPLAFELALGRGPDLPALTAVAPDQRPPAAATIRADLLALLALLEGRLDGDALFFERALVVEGDMELVLALRNAIDDADIDLLRDLATMLGPLAPLAERAGRDVLALHGVLERALLGLRAALLAPLARRVERLEAELRRLDSRVAARPPRVRPTELGLP
jgi:O2-independent ubiquinone biosynthesis accessory factor UbiT